MIRVISGKRQRRICCDNCRRVLGIMAVSYEDRLMDPSAGYVLGVGKRSGIMIHTPTGRREVIEHPIACSDACEDRLLKTWPRTDAADVHSTDWGEDFRDADLVPAPREKPRYRKLPEMSPRVLGGLSGDSKGTQSETEKAPQSK